MRRVGLVARPTLADAPRHTDDDLKDVRRLPTFGVLMRQFDANYAAREAPASERALASCFVVANNHLRKDAYSLLPSEESLRSRSDDDAAAERFDSSELTASATKQKKSVYASFEFNASLSTASDAAKSSQYGAFPASVAGGIYGQ